MQVTSIQHVSAQELADVLSSVGDTPIGIQVSLTGQLPQTIKSVVVAIPGQPLYFCGAFARTSHFCDGLSQEPLPPVHAFSYQTIHTLSAMLRAGFQFKSIKDPFIAGDMMQYTFSTKDPFSSLCRDLLPAVYADAATSIKAIEPNDFNHPAFVEAACVADLYQEVANSLMKDRSPREQALVTANLDAQAASNLLLAKGSYQGFPVDLAKLKAAADKMGRENGELDAEIVGEIRGHMGWPEPNAKPENSLF